VTNNIKYLVAQMATASILISTSVFTWHNNRLSQLKIARQRSPKTHAFIVSGIGCLTEVFPLNLIGMIKPLLKINESIK